MNFFFSSRRRHTFFFQAEDGIRDRSPSRGLGDVYKRQLFYGYIFRYTFSYMLHRLHICTLNIKPTFTYPRAMHDEVSLYTIISSPWTGRSSIWWKSASTICYLVTYVAPKWFKGRQWGHLSRYEVILLQVEGWPVQTRGLEKAEEVLWPCERKRLGMGLDGYLLHR